MNLGSSPIFVPTHNLPLRKDVTGAFLPEAKAFRERHGGVIYRIDNHLKPELRATEVLATLYGSKHVTPHRAVTFFCHGLARSIQLGFDIVNVQRLARAIRATSLDDVTVILYACSTASGLSRKVPGGDGGFADRLRDALVAEGAKACRVMAHTTPGHCTRNPHVRFFEGAQHMGGVDVIDSRDDLWRRWAHALRTEYRFDFPFKSIEEIRAFLEVGGAPL